MKTFNVRSFSINALSIVSLLISFTCVAQKEVPLKVGQPIPNLVLTNLVNYNKSSISIDDFKGKFIIIDFWATWCSPCLNFFKTTQVLEKKFKDKLVVIPVTYESSDKVDVFLEKLNKKNGSNIRSVVNDVTLTKLFPYTEIPHEVWIDEKGIVRAITSHFEVNESSIEKAVNNNIYPANQKIDLPRSRVDYKMPVLTGTQGEKFLSEGDVLYKTDYSVLAKYQSELGPGGNLLDSSVLCINMPIISILKLAFGEFKVEYINNNRVDMQLEDSTLINYPLSWSSETARFNEWQNTHSFCYEIRAKEKIPVGSHALKETLDKMKVDCNNFFSKSIGVYTSVEKRMQKCYVLKSITGDSSKLKSTGDESGIKMDKFGLHIRNMKFINFISNLYTSFQTDKYPMVDGTGWNNMIVDMDVNCELGDMNELNEALKKYDLQFILEDKEIDMIVIKKIK